MICNGSCSYLGQPVVLVSAWTLLIMGSLCYFFRILMQLAILRIQNNWCFEFWFISAIQRTILHGSCQYLVQLLASVEAWTLYIMVTLCLFHWAYKMPGWPKVPFPCTIFFQVIILVSNQDTKVENQLHHFFVIMCLLGSPNRAYLVSWNELTGRHNRHVWNYVIISLCVPLIVLT